MHKHCLALLIPFALGFADPVFPRVERPALALAERYQEGLNPARYLVSEKLDGARAYWDGHTLLSRGGLPFHTPDWFTAGFPDTPLDGELWMGRGQFQRLMRVVRDTEADTDAWQAVRYAVFDLPAARGGAEQRQRELDALIDGLGLAHVSRIPQRTVTSRAALQHELRQVVAAGGEGLMLQHRESPYNAGRHAGLLKLTPFEDAEAVVVGYTAGRGKHTGRVGALVVEDGLGKVFKLGTGLSDAEREQPPAVGSVVTYRFRGHTDSGLPRFARFVRERPLDH